MLMIRFETHNLLILQQSYPNGEQFQSVLQIQIDQKNTTWQDNLDKINFQNH